jgi:transcriptional regulator with XRE-family HTH domain
MAINREEHFVLAFWNVLFHQSRMKLDEHLASTAVSHSEFAAKIGVSKKAVDHWIAGRRLPRPEQMRRIIEATNGAVGPGDFYRRPEPATAPAPSPFTPEPAR